MNPMHSFTATTIDLKVYERVCQADKIVHYSLQSTTQETECAKPLSVSQYMHNSVAG